MSGKPSGLYTHLLFNDAPKEKRRLPIIYQDATMGDEKAVRAVASRAAKDGVPLVLNIEQDPTSGGKLTWWLDTVLDSAADYGRAADYMLTRLGWAREEGAAVALWSRPSQNALSSISKPSRREELTTVYEQRWRDAGPVLGWQDFVAIELYLPRTQRPHEWKGWPKRELIARGELFADHARAKGFAPLLFVSPTYSGIGDAAYIPSEWLFEIVQHFLSRGDAVVIWGGHRRTWDPEHPVSVAIQHLMETSKR